MSGADLTVVAQAKCDQCGKIINIFKCFPDWGRDWETGDVCPGCKEGILIVSPVAQNGNSPKEDE